MKIGIIPSIKKFYKNQFEYNCDVNLLQFFKKNFKNFNIEILTFDKKIDTSFKLVVISGGNDLKIFNREKKNIIRARSPARISLAGGGTDLTRFFFDQGGSGISLTINKLKLWVAVVQF